MANVSIEHIELDQRGVARIAGSRMKVIQIVMEKMANGWGPEEIHEQFPHLSLAQIHAAFVYYYDHKAELDQQIQESVEFADTCRDQSSNSVIVEKLRERGKLP